MAGEVVLGYDGPSADAALRTATRIAAAMQVPLVLVFGYQPALIGGEVGDMKKAVREVAQGIVETATEQVHGIDPSVQVVTELVDDKPAEAILRAGDLYDAPFLVVGAASRGPIGGALLGSVTYQVVHRSTRAVVVVPSPHED